jgi:endoglycosylceramidase
LLQLSILPLPLCGADAVPEKVHLGSRHFSSELRFLDAHGRERIFHGTNVIVKGPPWLPRLDRFDPLTSLVEEDFVYMKQVGINLLRLGVMWPGAEPVQGQYDEKYYADLRKIIKMAGSFGMHVLLDMHQDNLSEKFCGEGIPSWAVLPPKHSHLNFPVPLMLTPAHLGEDGFPTREACHHIFTKNLFEHGWASGQGAFATGYAYEALYTNKHNLTNVWGAFWAKTASVVRDLDNVLGFELINEPFAGNPYGDPLIMSPGIAESWRLQGAYDTLVQHIRQVDDKTLIFFAGTTWTNTHAAGFKHAPGGHQEANRSVFAYHYYDPPNPRAFEPYYATKRQDATRLGTGLMMTESCCGNLWEHVVPDLAANGHSWIHWEWKDFCREDNTTIKSSSQFAAYGACKTGFGAGPWSDDPVPDPVAMARFAVPYAPVVAGSLEGTWWNNSTGNFTLRFLADPSVPGPTEVFLGESFHFNTTDFTVSIAPNVLVAEHQPAAHRLLLTPRPNMSAVVPVVVQVTRRGNADVELGETTILV